jgi:hypothetical protein
MATPLVASRPHHATQPEDKLIPARVQLDENGNPMFFYQDPTPRKQSPKIDAPQSILHRFHHSRRHSGNKHPIVEFQTRQRHGEDVHRVLSLHHSLLDDYDNDDISLRSKSSIASSVAGSVTSLTNRVKLRIQRHRRKKLHKSFQDCEIVDLSPLKERDYKEKIDSDGNKISRKSKLLSRLRLSRRSSHSSNTSQSSCMMYDTEEIELPIVLSANGATSHSTVLPQEPVAVTPPPVATLKAAMERLSSRAEHEVGAYRFSEPALKPRSLVLPDKEHRLLLGSARTVTPPEAGGPVRSTHTASQTIQSQRSIRFDPSARSQKSNFKIYLLLLHPATKIFELIQLYFDPTTTTVRDVLLMIPANATETALGTQEYTGFCRPNAKEEEDKEISDFGLLIQNHDNMKLSAQIVRGEVLVAIPVKYTCKHVASLSQQILVNPRICRLLDKQDRKNGKKQRHSHRRHRFSRKAMDVLQKHDEETTSAVQERWEDMNDVTIERAMENAMTAAAAANAAVHGLKGRTQFDLSHQRHSYAVLSPSVTGTEESLSLDWSMRSTSTTGNSLQTDASENSFSMNSGYADKSYSSWSQSLDTSMNFSTIRMDNGASQQAVAKRRQKTLKQMRRAVLCLVAVMLLAYWRDPNGYASRNGRMETLMAHPFDVTGLLHIALFLLILVKLQFLCRLPPIQVSSYHLNKTSKCPFVKARASFQAAATMSPNKRRSPSRHQSM